MNKIKKILLNIKPFQETLHSDMCGPASLKMVLNYYGIDKSEQDIVNLTKFIPGLGISSDDICEASESLGFKCTIKNESTLNDVSEWLQKKIPVIVDWFTRGRSDYSDSEVADGHYSVVIGIDEQYVYMQDPEIGGMRKIAKDDFMKVWFDFAGNIIIQKDDLIIRQLIAVYH
jgi:predicted double-glycine peptidase